VACACGAVRVISFGGLLGVSFFGSTLFIISSLHFSMGRVSNFNLSFGENPWFDVQGQIQRCDWLENTHSLHIHVGRIQKSEFSDQSQRCIAPRTSNHGMSPHDSASDSG